VDASQHTRNVSSTLAYTRLLSACQFLGTLQALGYVAQNGGLFMVEMTLMGPSKETESKLRWETEVEGVNFKSTSPRDSVPGMESLAIVH
jgi:hypothetical protein